jgi:hypothetical protein
MMWWKSTPVEVRRVGGVARSLAWPARLPTTLLVAHGRESALSQDMLTRLPIRNSTSSHILAYFALLMLPEG